MRRERKSKRPYPGFILMEVMVALILIGIGLVLIGTLYISGRFLSQGALSKNQAMAVASSKMEEYLAKSYAGLEVDTITGSENGINWEVSIENSGEGDIPYKQITVIVSYKVNNVREEDIDRYVRIKGIKPYPYVHTEMLYTDSSQTVTTAYADITTLTKEVDYEIEKDILVIYNIALDIESSAGIDPIDTIYTACFIDGVRKDIETRTPILSQPLINNVLAINDVSKGEHTISIRWYKDTSEGLINLKEANLAFIATESRD